MSLKDKFPFIGDQYTPEATAHGDWMPTTEHWVAYNKYNGALMYVDNYNNLGFEGIYVKWPSPGNIVLFRPPEQVWTFKEITKDDLVAVGADVDPDPAQLYFVVNEGVSVVPTVFLTGTRDDACNIRTRCTFKIPSYCQLYGVKEDVMKELTSK